MYVRSYLYVVTLECAFQPLSLVYRCQSTDANRGWSAHSGRDSSSGQWQFRRVLPGAVGHLASSH